MPLKVGTRFTRDQAKEWLSQNKPRPAIRKCAEIWGWNTSSVYRFFVSLDIPSLRGNADDAYLACLDAATEQGCAVYQKPGRNYAPTHFADMPQAAGHQWRALADAQERLLTSGLIHVMPSGPPSRRRLRIKRKATGTEAHLSCLINLSHSDFIGLLTARYQRKQELLLAAKAEVAAAEKMLNDLGRRINGHV